MRALLSGLQFANGVTLSKEGDYVLVNETSAYRITRYWLQAQKAGDYYYHITQVTPFGGKLYFGSVHINGVATISNPLGL